MKPHVLAVRLDSDGDVLVTGPAIRALAARAGRLTLLCGPRGRSAAHLLPGPDEVLMHTAPWIDPDPPPVRRTDVERLVGAVRERSIGAAVVFASFHQSPLPTALLLRLAGVRFIAAISDDYPGSLLDVRHRVDEDMHEVERAVSLAEAAGFPPAPGDDLRLAIKPVAAAPDGRPYVVVHPGASVPARAWTPESCRRLVELLTEAGHRVQVTGGSSERRLTAYVAGGISGAADLGGRTTFAELARVLAGASAVVCGNTGPAHLAAAVGTPVVSLYAPTVPAGRWRPWGVPHALLGDQEIACAGCRARVCPVPGHPCLSVVRPAEVRAAVETLVHGSTGDVCASREAGLNREPMHSSGTPER